MSRLPSSMRTYAITSLPSSEIDSTEPTLRPATITAAPSPSPAT